MKISNSLTWLLWMLTVISMISCQKWDQMDPPTGNQKQPKPVVDPAYSGAGDPVMGEEDGTFYIFSSNAEISGVTYSSGLLMRTTTNLVNMVMSEENAYILKSVVDDWAGNRLLALDETIDVSKATISQPSLRKIGNMWHMFYAVQAGTKASVIGYATTTSLSGGEWEDHGEILFSDTSSNYKAAAPSICVGADGTSLFMAFGHSTEGVYIVQLDPTSKSPNGTPTLVASRADGTITGNPEILYYDGYYHLMFTVDGDLPLTCHAASTDPLGTYTDFSGRQVNSIASFWEVTRVLTNFQHAGGKSWNGVGAVSTYYYNNQYFLLHQAMEAGGSDPTLHIRQLNWLKDSRKIHTPEMPVPAICPTRYFQDNDDEITINDMVGDWYYGTLWGDKNSGINDPMSFNADGSYDGGDWDFDPLTHILHLTSSEWGGENIYLYVSKSNDWDSDKALTIVASGVNDTFGDFPGAWMKKQGSISNEPTYRTGVYDPAMARDAKFWIFTSNAAIDGYDYEKGIVVKSSEDLIFMDEEGYVLSGVIDNWAAARLKELDADIEDADIVMGQPSVRKIGGEWRLYYSVQAGTNASVIGYATSTSLENQNWVDKGEVIYSDPNTTYKAMSPSICATTDGHFLAFGEGTGFVQLVQLNETTGAPITTPQTVVGSSDASVSVGAPEMMYYNGYYCITATYFNCAVIEAVATSPTGPYYDYGNRNLTDGTGYADCRILTPYHFEGGASWGYTDGISICEDNENWYAIHHVANTNGGDTELNIRALNWIEDSRTTTSSMPFPALSPMPYTGIENDAVLKTDIDGTIWDYGSLWWKNSPTDTNGLSDPIMQFNDDGTYSHAVKDESGTITSWDAAGTWNYDESSQIMLLSSTVWGGEQIFVKVHQAYDWDAGKNTLVGSGFNDTFWIHPSVWMKKQ